MKFKVALFDIDGTLMNSGGAGRSAINEAVKLISGIDSALEGIRLHGNTDKLIMADLERKHGISLKKGDRDQIEELYLKFLPIHLKKEDVRQIPGAIFLLDYFKQQQVDLGITTGNLELGAYAKLQAVGLKSYFNYGGFGDDGIERKTILNKGVERSGYKHDEVIYFGDTPFDGEAGVLAGVITVGVTTGIYGVDELLKSGCACVVSSLDQVTPALLHAISNHQFLHQ
jgi:phosphoglycolate phosphatase